MIDHVTTELREGVLEVRLNRPEKKNALTTAMYASLAVALKRADADPAVRVVWLTGSADSFTSGNDVSNFVERAESGGISPAQDFLLGLWTVETPLMAAVNGLAVGIGSTLLLHCDIVHAARSATFRFPFTDLGVFPEAASTVLLPRIAGHQKAMEMFLLGDRFGVETAVDAGFVNAVFDDAELETRSLEVARRLAQKPPAAVRLTKRLVRQGYPDLHAVIKAEAPLFDESLNTPEAQEAFNAFLEKRKPDFSKFS